MAADARTANNAAAAISSVLQVCVHFLSGEEKLLEMARHESVAAVRLSLRKHLAAVEQRDDAKTGSSHLKLLCGTRALRDDEVLRHLESLELMAIMVHGWRLGDGYYNHEDIKSFSTDSLEEAEDVADKTEKCVAFARQRVTGQTYLVSRKLNFIRTNGEEHWDWYDKVQDC
ncbi:unnamed protein product [Polarella glacialis]|uniref:Uncharacterized protein n=1 Tax=Polarella glacialis TaxID=89957 RepID=A0A813LW20_POLGL|nr:unnamed protein product [Polarella glacialis]CAE8739502.1 unnamed protein product [Polarella glacialis]